MTAVRVYFEGDPKLRQGFRQFFKALYHSGVKTSLVACKGNAIADFMTAMKSHKEAVNVLLIDSEGPSNQTPLAQVKSHNHWEPGAGGPVTEHQVHFMVQLMEAWFLADHQALEAYYGQGFVAGRLPGNSRVEEVEKGQVLQALENATRDTKKGKYHKTRHAPELLVRISADKARSVAPSCDRLFVALERFLAN